MERQAKIVATLGPISSDEGTIAGLVDAGLDVVRLNLSHGDHESHRRTIENVRRVAAAKKRYVPVLLDLMGPRYRLGRIDGRRVLEVGQELSLGEAAPDVDLPVEDPDFLDHVARGERLLVDNGLVELEVVEVRERRLHVRVLHGGAVSTRKGLNLPDTDLPFVLSEKDRDDIAFAIACGADFLAVSFVGGPEDLEAVREVALRAGGNPPLVAKLERAAVTRRLGETVRAADAVMVARGDLGVEVPLHEVPVWQKKIVRVGRRLGKPVIVATQMLESMMENPRPTRAETTDVANAVFDGADALMLSGETAAGKYPVQVVATMSRIIREAEAYELSRPASERESRATRPTPAANGSLKPLLPADSEIESLHPERDVNLEIPEVVSGAAVAAADRLGARRIVAFSQGGFTARMIARHRPEPPITVITPDFRVARRVQLVWGARPLVIEHEVRHHDEVVEVVDRLLLEAGLAEPGDAIVILMGDPIDQKPLTNLMRVHRVRAQEDNPSPRTGP